jgi:hypothetical protein
VPTGRMGPPLRSFAADAHGCIMVRVLGPNGYKVVARLIAPASELPSDRHSDRSKRAVALETARRRYGLSNRTPKPMKEKRCAALVKLLD